MKKLVILIVIIALGAVAAQRLRSAWATCLRAPGWATCLRAPGWATCLRAPG